MNQSKAKALATTTPHPRTAELFREHQDVIFRRTDRLFAVLMVLQWFFAVGMALWVSPRTWAGDMSQINPHVWAAVFFGGMVTSFPVLLAWRKPGTALTRHVIAIGQMLMSTLLVHLTGGRLETHFHVFGSLAFLAMYRDWRVLISATVIVAVDHFARGVWWPQSVFGILTASPWRWLEHAGWVIFEDIFLIVSIRQSVQEMWSIAERQAELASANTALQEEVTERKHAQEELLKAKETAESATQAKSEFLASMSHEIRTPMNGVIGMLGLLQDSGLPGRQREFAQIARSSADSLLAIINDILDFSKIEAGKLTIEPIPFDLQSAIEDVAEIFAPRVAQKNLDLIVRYAPHLPRHIVGDPGRVRQVLTNFVSNAIKFTPQGHVLINIQFGESVGSAKYLKLAVEDTGVGISEDKLQYLFEKFTQADASTTRKFGGTGLGLAICRQLANLMGGTVGVTSQAGKGSTFWFTLPLIMPENESAAPPPRLSLEGVRVLIVDDNEVNRRVLHEQIIGWRMRNGGFASGEESLHVLREAQTAGDPYHIVVLDYQMPGMDGEMLAKAIKADAQLKETVLVMLTSVDRPADSKRLSDAGIFACLVKPVRQSRLWDTLATAWSARANESSIKLLTRTAPAEPVALRKRNRKLHARVLVTDDNSTNQKVARLMLENLGCRVDISANGKEAVEMLDLLPYDAVFMDCEMPEMDGYEATAEIRRRQDGRHHVPIIAMTAKAIQGDREECLRAGMDDYISKPVRLEDLEAALERWTPAETPAPVAAEAKADARQSLVAVPTLDPTTTANLRKLAAATDPSVLTEIYQAFISDARKYLLALRCALETGASEELRKVAHTLKGASGNIGATALAETALQLEKLGNAQLLNGADALLARSEMEFEQVRTEIEKQNLAETIVCTS